MISSGNARKSALALPPFIMLLISGCRRSAGLLQIPAISRRMEQFSSLVSSHTPSASMTDSLLLKVDQTIQNDILKSISSGVVTLIVGVSGGCDSVALFHTLRLLRSHRPWELRAVHFDHQQRGSESDADRSLTQKLCKQYDVPLDCFFWHECDATNFSQDTARRWRRSRMLELRDQQSDPTLLVTAHHKDDSEETLLLKLLRGVHLSNLSGIQPLENGTWARPLIHVRKEELVEFLNENGWEWREDASNQSPKYLRNRVRNELMPLLRDIVGDKALERRLENMEDQAKLIREDKKNRVEKNLESQGEDSFLLPQDCSRASLFISLEAFHEWAKRKGCLVDYEQSQRIRSQIEQRPHQRWTLNIGNHWNVDRCGESLRLWKDSEVRTPPLANQVEVQWSFPVSSESSKVAGNAMLICIPLSLRNPRFYVTRLGAAKLYITPSWRDNPVKATDLLRGQKVPLHMREEAPVILLTSGDGEGERELVGVYVETTQRWICDAKFGQTEQCGDSEKIIVLDVGLALRGI